MSPPHLFVFFPCIKKKESLVCFTGQAEEAGIALIKTGRFYRERASGQNLMKRDMM